MHRVCPLPNVWADIHHELVAFAKSRGTEKPPTPLILAG